MTFRSAAKSVEKSLPSMHCFRAIVHHVSCSGFNCDLQESTMLRGKKKKVDRKRLQMNTNTALSVSSFNTFRKQVADAINILDKKIREILDSDITGGDNTGATVALASCPTSK